MEQSDNAGVQSRRQFLKGAAVAATAPFVLGPSALGAAESSTSQADTRTAGIAPGDSRAGAFPGDDGLEQRGLDQHPRPVSSGQPAFRPAARWAPGGGDSPYRPGSTGSNGDEDRYPNRIGNYHKGLPHDQFGEVIPAAYDTLRSALESRSSETFEQIAMGLGRKLTNPQAGFATDMEGPHPARMTMRSAPRLAGSEEAGEMVELYWMALLRDVPFTKYHRDDGVAQAAEELSRLNNFHGPRDRTGKVTPATLFRGSYAGDLVGPYVSQFLLLDIPYGTLNISHSQKTAVPGVDYLTDYNTWLAVQNGATQPPHVGSDQYDGVRRRIRSARDLATYVHLDALYEAYLNACLILLGLGAPLDEGNPYKNSRTQIGFGTFGGPHILSLVCEVATRALKAIWYQKWSVHRRLRPEAYGGLVHLTMSGAREYPLHRDILNSQAVEATASRYGTFLLPIAFPEGSPTHPSYGSGHATVAGACVTILKAWFDESYVLANPVVPSADGTGLVPYTGPDRDRLTIGGELNKVAANIATGRNMAGIHWRSDYSEAVKLGEQVAIEILQQQSPLYNENPHSFTLTKFDGTSITI